MPTTTNFEQDFSTQPIQPISKRKFPAKKRFSDFRRRFSSFSPRNSIIFMKPDLDKEEISCENFNNHILFVKDNNNSLTSLKKHQRSTSEQIEYCHYDDKFDDFFDDFEEIEEIQYTPIFTRNKNQMNNLINYEEPTNEIVLDEPSSSLIKFVVKKFIKAGQDKKRRDKDKEYQDGKTNPFE